MTTQTEEKTETPIDALHEIVRPREDGFTSGILDNPDGIRTVWDRYEITSFKND